MANIEKTIERCNEVISKWHDRAVTLETVEDFAKVFDLELDWSLRPVDNEPSKPVAKPEQGEFTFELSEDDQWAFKGWRENNGL